MNDMAVQRGDGGLRELALFAGAGGGILGGTLLGWRTVCAVELDAYAASVLVARQNDGFLDPFPIWDDIRTFKGRPWRGIVDVISGGFPCTDISLAGKGAGITGKQSGLWKEFARIIREVRPAHVFVENSPALTSRGLGVVLGDLAALGFNARWGVLGADDVGAPHIRKRIWIVANANGAGRERTRPSQPARRFDAAEPPWPSENVSDSDGDLIREQPGRLSGANGAGSAFVAEHGRASYVANSESVGAGKSTDQTDAVAGEWSARVEPSGGGWWAAEPDVDRVVDRLAHRVDRLRAIGNGQVPRVAALAWETLR